MICDIDITYVFDPLALGREETTMMTRRTTLQIAAAAAATAGTAQAAGPGDLLAALGAQAPYEQVTVGGSRIALTRRGKGRSVLCLHAVGHGARDFEALAQRIGGDGFEVIAIDFPGHGRSPADGQPIRAAHHGEIAAGVIAKLGLKRPILLGNSLGGGAAMTVAARDPKAVAGLVLCDTSGLVPPSPLAAGFVQQMIGLFQSGVAGAPSYPEAFAAYYRTVLPGEPAKAQRDRVIAAAAPLAPVLVDAWTGFALPSNYLGDLIPSLTLPTWFAWAKNDRVIAWDFCKAEAARFPNHRIDFFEGGHSAFMEDPDAFAAGFRAFAKTLV